MLGFRMPAAGYQLQYLNYPLWILIFFVIFQFSIELILELHGCLYYRRNKSECQLVIFVSRSVPLLRPLTLGQDALALNATSQHRLLKTEKILRIVRKWNAK